MPDLQAWQRAGRAWSFEHLGNPAGWQRMLSRKVLDATGPRGRMPSRYIVCSVPHIAPRLARIRTRSESSPVRTSHRGVATSRGRGNRSCRSQWKQQMTPPNLGRRRRRLGR
jgi:hypothetical protein